MNRSRTFTEEQLDTTLEEIKPSKEELKDKFRFLINEEVLRKLNKKKK